LLSGIPSRISKAVLLATLFKLAKRDFPGCAYLERAKTFWRYGSKCLLSFAVLIFWFRLIVAQN
jgi:hypothetical protein